MLFETLVWGDYLMFGCACGLPMTVEDVVREDGHHEWLTGIDCGAMAAFHPMRPIEIAESNVPNMMGGSDNHTLI